MLWSSSSTPASGTAQENPGYAQAAGARRGSVQKTVKLALNAFPTTPSSLIEPDTGITAARIDVELADLFHQYYNDTYGEAPPSPDPAHFEHVQHLLPCKDFRFKWNGQGINKTAKGHKSNELGQAFCRWFLSEHLDIDYIAHLDEVRDHGALAQFGDIRVSTKPGTEGDAPDYFCATGDNQVCLAEAKGTGHAVGFGTRAFQKWRDQFERVEVRDASGGLVSVKGYVVAMRWAFEGDSTKTFTTLSAEDPQTPGRRSLGERDGDVSLAYATKSLHFAASLRRLRQPLIAAALQSGLQIPPDLLFNATVWKSLWPPIAHLRFVGGYYPSRFGATLPYRLEDGKLVHTPPDALRLDIASGTFVGIEERTFKMLAATARDGPARIGELRPLERTRAGYSGISLLRDGHVLGPIEFFYPIESITL